MNDLSTSQPSGAQNTWSSLPWGTFLFLLAVFIFSSPLWNFSSFKFSDVGFDDARGVAQHMHKDNLMRIFALFFLGVFALFNLLKYKTRRFQINGLGWLILLYLVLCVLSIIWSVDPRFTLKRVFILLLLSLGALYVAYLFSLQETKALILFICGAGVSIGLVAAFMYNDFLPFVGKWRFGNNMHPIQQGWHLGLLLLSALAFANTDKQNRNIYIGIVIIAFLLLILTRSRMAFISCIIASAVYMGLVVKNHIKGVSIFLGIVIVVCSLYFILGSDFMGLTEQVATLGRVGEMKSAKTLTGRIPLWKAIIELVNQRPFVGWGYDSFLIGKNLEWIAENHGWATNSPHSGYIQTMGGLGYIGFILLVVILILSVTMSLNLTKRNSDYAFLAAVIVWLILNLYTENQVLTRPYFPVFTWMTILAKLGFMRKEN